MSMRFARGAAAALALSAGAAIADTTLTIAIVNNGHMINMQKVAEEYTAKTGVKLNWVPLEEGELREQVTSDTATPRVAASTTSSISACRKHQSGARPDGSNR